jgi:hypothetical protein
MRGTTSLVIGAKALKGKVFFSLLSVIVPVEVKLPLAQVAAKNISPLSYMQ